MQFIIKFHNKYACGSILNSNIDKKKTPNDDTLYIDI